MASGSLTGSHCCCSCWSNICGQITWPVIDQSHDHTNKIQTLIHMHTYMFYLRRLLFKWEHFQTDTQVHLTKTVRPFPSLVPRLLSTFQCFMRQTREPGRTYHASDIAGGTNLFNSSGTKSSQFHPLRHLCDKFYQAPSFLSCRVEKMGRPWVRGYLDTSSNRKYHPQVTPLNFKLTYIPWTWYVYS